MADPLTWAIAGLAGGTVLSAGAQMQSASAAKAQGKANQTAAYYEAQQLDAKAGQERATSQRNAMESRRQERIVQSNLQAAAAASGGGAVDPTIGRLASGIAIEGQYRALSDLYSGEDRARGLEDQASARRYEGDVGYMAGKARAASERTAAIGTIFSGVGTGATLYSKYG
jgi:hypothetical protein